MKRLMPSRKELAILATMAIGFAVVASSTMSQEFALSAGAVPLFIGSCLLGMKRNGQLSRRD